MASAICVNNDYYPNDFTGFSLTNVVLPPVNAAATGAATAQAANVAATAQTATVAAAPSIAATLPVAFNSQNLPADV